MKWAVGLIAALALCYVLVAGFTGYNEGVRTGEFFGYSRSYQGASNWARVSPTYSIGLSLGMRVGDEVSQCLRWHIYGRAADMKKPCK